MNPQQPFDPFAPQTPQPSQPVAPAPQPVQPMPPTPQPPIGNPYLVPSASGQWKLTAISAIAAAVVLLGLGVWALVAYLGAQSDVDAKVDRAVAEAVKVQAQKDADDYAREKAKDTQLFAGPEDFGQLSFSYRKDWSLYVASEGSSSKDYQAYFNPGGVPAVGDKSARFALRVTIKNESYEKVLDTYAKLVESGSLTSSSVKFGDDTSGTRFDGAFSDDVRGAAVVFKIRDKTVVVQTDAETFKNDFNALIATITFNK